jgi:hypothetical protein
MNLLDRTDELAARVRAVTARRNPLRKSPRGAAPEKPPGVKHWDEMFGGIGAPWPGERGYIPPPERVTWEQAAAFVRDVLRHLQDGEAGPMIAEWLDDAEALPMEWRPDDDYDDDGLGYDADYDTGPLFDIRDLPAMLGYPAVDPYTMADLVAYVWRAQDEADLWDVGLDARTPLAERLVVGIVREALEESLLDAGGDAARRQRLVPLPKDDAAAFVRHAHSAFKEANPKGFLAAYGLKVGHALLGVAWLSTPSGRFEDRPGLPKASIVELARVATLREDDGGVKGASSKLVARALDLLPRLGRPRKDPTTGAWVPTPGLLLVTYSLLTERGTTYLALADRGLRPVGLTDKRASATGTRAGSSASRPLEQKVIWHYGPAAHPPRWDVLPPAADPKQVAGAVKQFDAWQRRQAAEAARAARRGAR